MVERDFDRELKEMMVGVAARDSDLVAFYEVRMLGDSDAVGEGRLYDLARYDPLQLASEIRRDYNLTEQQYRQALGLCIASIAGVQVGRDLF